MIQFFVVPIFRHYVLLLAITCSSGDNRACCVRVKLVFTPGLLMLLFLPLVVVYLAGGVCITGAGNDAVVVVVSSTGASDTGSILVGSCI